MFDKTLRLAVGLIGAGQLHAHGMPTLLALGCMAVALMIARAVGSAWERMGDVRRDRARLLRSARGW